MQLPKLNGNWVDFVIIIFIIFYIWENWGKNFLVLTTELILFVVSFVLSLEVYQLGANLLIDNLAFPLGLAKAISFIGLWLLFESSLGTLASLIFKDNLKSRHQGLFYQLLATLPLFTKAVIIITIILTMILVLPIRGDVKQAISTSKLGSPLLQIAQQLENDLKQIFGEAITETISFITVDQSTREKISLNFVQPNLSIDNQSEERMVELVNQERSKLGLPPYKVDTNLRDLARSYAQQMFEQGFFSHYGLDGKSPFDRMEQAGIFYLEAGENLAFAPSVAVAHQGLMNSPGHRKNILEAKFTKVGIGVIDGGIYGKIFVQEFTD